MIVTSQGFEEIDRRFRRLGHRKATSIMKRSLRAGGKLIVKSAKSKINRRSGTLARSIGQVTRKGKLGQVRVTIAARKGKSKRNDGWYAHFVEFGTEPHGISRRDDLSSGRPSVRMHPGARATPFMRPALDETENDALRAIEQTAIDLITASLAGR